MNLKLTLTALLLIFSNLTAQETKISQYIQTTHKTLKTLEEMTKFEFYNLNINLKKRTITYPLTFKNSLYFHIEKDHNGKPLYFLTYNFYLENVQTYLKKLQRITQRRTNKKTKNYPKTS